MKKFNLIVILGLLISSAVLADNQYTYKPLKIDANLIKERRDLQKTLAQLEIKTKDSLGPMIEYTNPEKPDIAVQLSAEVVEFILDLRSGLRREVTQTQPGSEMLFFGLDLYDPPFEKLDQFAEALQFATSILLFMPDGNLFFETPSGLKMRAIFSKLRTAPNAKLDYRKLTEADRSLLGIYMGAIFWRARGGGFIDLPKGTHDTRYYFVQYAFSSLGVLVGRSINPIGRSLKWALKLKGWGKWMDMGNTAKDDVEVGDLINMTDRGVYQVDGTFDEIEDWGGKPDIMYIAGSLMGPCYYWAWNGLSDEHYGSDLEIPLAKFIDSETAWGELCTGASIGLGITRSLPLK